jgi:hypothetical protein
MEILRSFSAFIRNPSSANEELLKPSKSLVLVILALVAIVLVSLLTSIVRYHLIENHEFLNDKLRSRVMTPGFSIYILVVLFAPIFEELAFRLGLRFSKLNIVISLSLVVTEILKIILGHFSPSDQEVTWLFYYLFDIFIFAAVFIMVYNILWKYAEGFFVKAYSQYFCWIIYTVAMLFALLHLNNYDFQYLTFSTFFGFVLIVFVQFSRALILSFIRLRSGILWSIFVHILINATSMLFFYYK